MSNQRLVKDVFLWSMSAIYMLAFASLYLQIPGLFGDYGLLPAKNLLRTEANSSSYEMFLRKPTLLWFVRDLGLTTQTGMSFFCVIGTCLGLLGIFSRAWRDFISFFSMWILYFSVYQVGQTFLWFQWDILLLETGFLCMVIAPKRTASILRSPAHDSISLWLVKWLLFRLMFASGVVKLTSGCPTWWGLTALNWHYESQCIPTPLAWFAHQLPDWFQKFSVAMTFVIEGPIPFLFFSPIRSLRIFAFYLQVFFQFLIIATGNYNFFNLLTIVLCLSLLDDDHLPFTGKKDHVTTKNANYVQRAANFIRKCIVLAVMFILLYWIKRLFSVKVNSKDIIYTKVDFSQSQFTSALAKFVPISIWIGAVSLGFEIFRSLFRCLQQASVLAKMYAASQWFIMACVAIWIFSISLVPYSNLDRTTQHNLWPIVKKWHNEFQYYEIVNSYGLFRRMTGVGGRPEIVIEGSDSLDGPWKEYNFLYKPGPLAECPPFVAPHQPRLDWQMWFAALGSYQHNPWFVHLVYKLLEGERDVLDLMGKKQPFKKAPRYVRALLYKYHYTKVKSDTQSIAEFVHNTRLIKSWWTREFTSEYLPPVSKTERTLQQFLSHYELGPKYRDREPSSGRLHKFLTYLRSKVRLMDPFKFLAYLFTLGVILNILTQPKYWIPERREMKKKPHVE